MALQFTPESCKQILQFMKNYSVALKDVQEQGPTSSMDPLGIVDNLMQNEQDRVEEFTKNLMSGATTVFGPDFDKMVEPTPAAPVLEQEAKNG